jgi:quinohemoprotein amine dehydrogenase alpha subunit-like protein
MWRSRLSLALAALIFGASLGWGWSGAGSPGSGVEQVDNPLPRDRDQQLVTGRCIICHSLEMIAQQRQTRAEWAVIVDRMITYGMPMQPGDREQILTYLAKHLGQ